MKKFGVYIFNLAKDNPSTGILSTDTMVGEVDMTSKSYDGLSVEDACKKRIANELSAKVGASFYTVNDVVNLKTLQVEADKENHIDTFLRKEIIKRTSATPVWTADDKKSELLRGVTVDEAYDEICKVYNPEARRTHSYGLRAYQQDIVDKAAEILKTSREVLVNLSTRGGKSFVSLELCRKMNASNILILTPFPAAEGSFRSEIECHTDFAGWKFFTKDDLRKDSKYEPELNCVFVSFQLTDPDLAKDKIDTLLSQVQFDTIVVDETHRMSSSDRSTKILSSIPHKYEIHLSGTPYNDLMTGRFSDDNTVTLDFIDLIKWDKTHRDSKDAVNFPELKIQLISNMKELNEKLVEYDPDAFSRDADFSFEKAFGDPRDKSLKKPIAFAKWLFSNNIFSKHSHYLVFVPSVQVAKVFPEVLKKVQTEFAVKGLNDEDVSSNYEKQINDFEQQNKKTIIVTCAKCTTGVTLKRCDAIVLLKKLNSAETFVQTLFRCMTPYKGKTSVDLYELDSEAAYKVIREVAAVHNALHAPKQSELDTYRELLETVAIESWDGEKIIFDEKLAADFLERVKSIPTYYNMEDVFDLGSLSDVLTKNEQLALLGANFGKSDKAAAQFIVAQNENATGSKSKNYAPTKLSEMSPVEDGNGNVEAEKNVSQNKLINQVKKFMLNLDWEIILNDADSFDKLLAYEAPEWKGNQQLISIYKKILKANKKSVSDFVEQYTQITLEKAKDDPEKLMELINKLSSLNDVDKRTPILLVDQMLDMLSIGKYDGSYILDPCVGTGSMLFEAWKRGWPKDHLIGTDVEPRFVKLLNKLGFENVFVKDCLEEDYEGLVDNIIKENDMKIIMNPPYDRNLHLKVADKMTKDFPDAEIVSLQPTQWLQNPFAQLNKNSDFNKFSDLRSHIKNIELQKDGAHALFSGVDWGNLAIYEINKNKHSLDFSQFIKCPDWLKRTILNFPDTLVNHCTKKPEGAFTIRVPSVYNPSGGNARNQLMTTDISKALNNFSEKDNVVFFNFDTEQEATSFFKTLDSKFYRFIKKNLREMSHNIGLKYFPYLNDYSHNWTDEDLYKYFNLTEDEINTIETEMSGQ